MLKVMIVDDEMLVKIGLRNVIPWEKHGYHIVGEAGNGKQALEIARKEHPDIVFTDLRMPIMDGLQFIETLKDEQPKVRFVILSAYRDFDYVQRAKLLGITEYILKLSMTANDLLEVLQRVRSDIESKTAVPAEFQKQLESLSDIMADPNHHVVSLPKGRLFRIVFCLPTPQKEKRKDEDSAIYLLTSSWDSTALPFHTADGFGIIAFEMPAKSKLPGIKRKVEEHLESPIALGISRPASSAALCEALACAKSAARHSFWEGQTSIFFAESLPSYVLPSKHAKWNLLQNALAAHQISMACDIMMELIDQPKPYISPEDCLKITAAFRFAISENVSETHFATFEALSQTLLQEIEGFGMDALPSAGSDMMTIVQYVFDNYDRMIRLSDVAQLVHRNETYISHLFRKEMNIKFVDFVTKVRVEKAKELLTADNRPISIIAEEVGFSDPAYFCRVFKKITLLSPQAYRNARSEH